MKNRIKVTKEICDAARALFGSGLDIMKVAGVLNLSRSTIYYIKESDFDLNEYVVLRKAVNQRRVSKIGYDKDTVDNDLDSPFDPVGVGERLERIASLLGEIEKNTRKRGKGYKNGYNRFVAFSTRGGKRSLTDVARDWGFLDSEAKARWDNPDYSPEL